MDEYRVQWVGRVGIGVHDKDGKSLSFTIDKEQSVPSEFKPGDEVTIKRNPDSVPEPAVGKNEGYYIITHIPTGKILRIMYLNEQFNIDQ